MRGLGFELAIQGSGTARIGEVDVDQMKSRITGAGSARLAGKCGKLTATIRGTSSFEGEAWQVKDAVIGAEGPSIVRASVTNTAKVDALGLASVTLTGNPACTVKAQGLGDRRGLQGGRNLAVDQRQRGQLAVEPRRKLAEAASIILAARRVVILQIAPTLMGALRLGRDQDQFGRADDVDPPVDCDRRSRRICWRAMMRCLTIQWSEPPTSSSIRFGRIRVGTRPRRRPSPGGRSGSAAPRGWHSPPRPW